MLDDDTIEVLLGPGTMPGTEITQELPIIAVAEPHPLPAHLANDPILTMEAPKATVPSLFDHTFGDRPAFYPARPHKAPRVPIRPKDHLLAALGAGVIVMGIATVILVESGYNSGLPQSEQERLHHHSVASAPADSGISQVPGISSPSPSPSAIPRHIRQAPPAPLSRHHETPMVLAHPRTSSESHSALPSPSAPTPHPSPSPTQSTTPPSTPDPDPSLPVELPSLPLLPSPGSTTHSSSPITPSP